MYPSPDPRPEAIRAQGTEILSALVLRGLSVAMFAQRAHWAVRGPMFRPMHKLFGKVYADLLAVTDRLAECGAALGCDDPMGYVETLPVAPLPSRDGLALCGALAGMIDGYMQMLDVAFARLEEMRLVADAGAVQAVIEDVRKLGWMVRSHAVTP